jgi:gag-polypeptide of LTR copia-type/Zinc knuckle
MSESSVFRFDALDDRNAPMWFHKMESALTYKKLWSAVKSTPKEGDSDSMALALIKLNIRDHHLGLLSTVKTAKEAWETLESTFKTKTKARRLELVRELHALRKDGNESLAAYFGRVRLLRDNITQAGETIKEDHIVCALLAGLPHEYDMVVAILTSSEDPLTLDNAFKQLVAVEQRSMRDAGNTSLEEARAFAAHKVNKKFGGEQRACYYCAEVGHLRANCPIKAKADLLRFKDPKGVLAL